MIRLLAAAVAALTLGLTTAACEINIDSSTVVAGNEAEQRVMDRHDTAQEAGGWMIVLFVLVVLPLGIAAAIVFAVSWARARSG
jgi:hypothetical protein